MPCGSRLGAGKLPRDRALSALLEATWGPWTQEGAGTALGTGVGDDAEGCRFPYYRESVQDGLSEIGRPATGLNSSTCDIQGTLFQSRDHWPIFPA